MNNELEKAAQDFADKEGLTPLLAVVKQSFKAGAQWQAEQSKKEAIEFAEWLRENYSLIPPNTGLKPKWISKSKWNFAIINSNDCFNEDQLYELFKKEKNENYGK